MALEFDFLKIPN